MITQRIETISTVQMRQRLAGLVDPQAEREAWLTKEGKAAAIQFCAALPAVLGQELDRMTMWNKIAAAIQSGYAKTVSGDIDLFIQHVLESIKADAALAVSNEKLTHAIETLYIIPEDQRQHFLQYLVTHLIPILVHARQAHNASKQ
jgi:hypothetical protein